MQAHNVGVSYFLKNISFGYINQQIYKIRWSINVFKWLTLCFYEKIFLNKLIFLQDLKSVWKTGLLMSHQVNFTERSSTNNFKEFKIFFCNSFSWLEKIFNCAFIFISISIHLAFAQIFSLLCHCRWWHRKSTWIIIIFFWNFILLLIFISIVHYMFWKEHYKYIKIILCKWETYFHRPQVCSISVPWRLIFSIYQN